ncbi:hypothetical protein Lal_00016683 [Lupinus albus]|nr:hypothetical protein Lal_00016683 [Lupinus albus]
MIRAHERERTSYACQRARDLYERSLLEPYTCLYDFIRYLKETLGNWTFAFRLCAPFDILLGGAYEFVTFIDDHSKSMDVLVQNKRLSSIKIQTIPCSSGT